MATTAESPTQPETVVYAQVHKRRGNDLQQTSELLRRQMELKTKRQVKQRHRNEIKQSNKSSTKAKNRVKYTEQEKECEQDLMKKEREVKALASVRVPEGVARSAGNHQHRIGGQEAPIPQPQQAEQPSATAQYGDTSLYVLAGPLPPVYDNVPSSVGAAPKEGSIESKLDGKRNVHRKPKPEPRSKPKRACVNENALPANKDPVRDESDMYIYEQPLPVDIVKAKRLQSANELEPPNMSIADKAYYEPTYNNLQETVVTEHSTPSERSGSKMIPSGYSVADSFCLFVYHRDITKAHVDAITSAANEHLGHLGGVARAIADAAGPELDKELREYAAKHTIGTSDVVKTTAGNLPYKAVLHAVVPRWPKSGSVQEKEARKMQLTKTFENILTRANKEHYTSIALPSLSSGIFGVPVETVAKAMIDAFLDSSFKLQRSKLKEVHVVDVTDDVIQLLPRELSSGGIFKAPNGKQVAITELPLAEIQRAVAGQKRVNARSNKGAFSKFTCGLGRKKHNV